MAAIATIVEKKIDDLKEIKSISNGAARTILLKEAKVAPVGEKQLPKDGTIKLSFLKAISELESVLPEGLGTIKKFLVDAKNTLSGINIPSKPETDYTVEEQKKLYVTSGYLSNLFTGLKTIKNAIKVDEEFNEDSKKRLETIKSIMGSSSEFQGVPPGGWDPDAFVNEMIEVANTEEGRRSLIAITSSVPSVASPEQPETSDEEDEETADPFVTFEERSKTDKTIKDNFAKFLNGKVGGPIGTEGFLKMKEIGLLNLDAAKEIMREFLKQYKK